jgi:2-polyprenyl-3-methyl-5-hydroxy-6-metoxy-1,4-benzoquinol methylase
MPKEQPMSNAISMLMVAIPSAIMASLCTSYLLSSHHKALPKDEPNQSSSSSSKESTSPPPNQDREKEENEEEEDEEEQPHHHLGPENTPELQYQLNLRGKVDRIYQHHGPKPFEFDSEVVSVFDDMVSRSVPLYCEVIDLAIYWFERYYQPGTKVYDLGCSTGTTLDVLVRATKAMMMKKDSKWKEEQDDAKTCCTFVGVDNSQAMVAACQEKLKWVADQDDKEDNSIMIDIRCDDILNVGIQDASFVIMNYTLQFVPVVRRQELLHSISKGLHPGGILLLSEKVRTACSELQETCTWIYEDFKERRKYTKREIARKKEALMNVLIPFTEGELRDALSSAGFENVEIVAKWNNFTTFVARKKAPVLSDEKSIARSQKKISVKQVTPHLDALFDMCPVYLNDYVESKLLGTVCTQRMQYFAEKGAMSNDTLETFDEIARMIQQLPKLSSKTLVVDQPVLTMGDPDELTAEQMDVLHQCVNALKPWKKGPLCIFGTHIDTEWRSDFKWERLQQSLPNLKDKVVCDLGCGNGYFMYRMLEYSPKLVLGVDPNLHAWLEFHLFQRISGVENIKFEYMRGDIMASFPGMFDVVFCLGVLYHTPDPITMLKDIHKSMKGKSVSYISFKYTYYTSVVVLFYIYYIMYCV